MTLTVEAQIAAEEATKVPGRPRALALLLAGAAGLLLADCADGPQKRDDPGMAQTGGAGSNVPAPPSVDRTKCSEKGKQVVTADINLDKKPDVWKFFSTAQQNGQSVSVLSCKQVDLNHDGKVDMVYYYDETGGQTTLEEFDLDFDGKFDVTTYYVGGKKVRKEEDTNLDNRTDVWTYLEDEKIVRVERDTDFNGKVDEWQYYEGGKLDRIGYDTTGSGRLDKWDRAPEGEPQPSEGSGAAPAAAPVGGTAPGPAATAPPAVAAPPVSAQTAKK
ncbi:MAG TPA: hypothetical protein VFH68_07845 [Polyangia bacterium]|jgi:hypothetical protein|nr:hypothetical protein [Polyangia bacterium]